NVQGSGGADIPRNFSVTSNIVSEKFNVTIPAGAHVTQQGSNAPVVENLTIQSGASLDTNYNTHVRHTFTNHRSGNLIGFVDGDFVNDALPASGNVAVANFTLQGQLQNTGELQLPQLSFFTIQSANTNAGTLAFTGGYIQNEVSLANNGTVTLAGGDITGP